VIIKYPNWYEHFQGLGFNLEAQPKLFDRIYTGTETRDAMLSNQHLQPYHGYSIVRYFENIKPGGNGGGWVDPFGMTSADRYAEQLWLTLFAKAPEISLFDFRSLQRPLTLADRAAWQDAGAAGAGPSFDFDAPRSPRACQMAACGRMPPLRWPLAGPLNRWTASWANWASRLAWPVTGPIILPAKISCRASRHGRHPDRPAPRVPR
jgi:hypothetical protein